MNLETALARLDESPLRVTQTRRILLQAIFKCKSPFSALDVLAAIPRKGKKTSIDLVTIYRNLPVLEEAGIICRADFSDDRARYMVSESGHHHHHHHIVCRACNQVEAVDFCIVEAQAQVLGKLGFKDVQHRLEFSGICPSCAKTK